MRKIHFTALLLLLNKVALSQTVALLESCLSCTAEQREILRLEEKESMALSRNDSATLGQLWAKDITCNCSTEVYDEFGTSDDVSIIRESKFVAQVGTNVFMSIGKEVIVRQKDPAGSESTVERKYTHIWSRTQGKWQLTAKYVYGPAH